MATGVQAVERFSEELEIIPAAVERAARALKETNPPMWAKGKQGGGKNAAHVTPQHVINLLLALMATDTRTEAPEAARSYRDLTPQRKHEETSEQCGAETRTSSQTFLAHGLGSLLTGNQPWKESWIPRDTNLGMVLEAVVREACKPQYRTKSLSQ